jgi:hypothetical protein
MRGNTIGAASTLIISAAAGVHASAAAEKPVFQVRLVSLSLELHLLIYLS